MQIDLKFVTDITSSVCGLDRFLNLEPSQYLIRCCPISIYWGLEMTVEKDSISSINPFVISVHGQIEWKVFENDAPADFINNAYDSTSIEKSTGDYYGSTKVEIDRGNRLWDCNMNLSTSLSIGQLYIKEVEIDIFKKVISIK